MALKVFNDLTKKIEIFQPIKKGEVKMYTCGPTVYNYLHIGNARSFLVFDVIKRYLKFKGYKVKHVQNITDVGHLTSDADEGEDKIIKQARKEGIDPYKISEHYTEAYFSIIDNLKIERPDINPKATEHIKDIIEFIKKLIKENHAYEMNGSIYYDVSSFKEYGKLSGNTLKKLQQGASKRTKKIEEKKNPEDFALWKKAPKEHLMKWDSPWGEGYPGWHIECSIMATKYLGKTIDIHGGGKDLIFPHHENEIAQTEAITKKDFAKYWLHNEFLLINNQKMSKSKNNYYTAQEMIDKHGNLVIRYYLISAHYRTELNITDEALKAAKKAVDKLQNFMLNLNNPGLPEKDSETDSKIQELCEETEMKFIEKMDDDFNTPGALGVIFEFIKKINKTKLSKFSENNVKTLMEKFDTIFDVMKTEKKEISEEIKKLITKREIARKNKDWATSDKIRDKLNELGIIIEDTKEGIKWKIK